MSNIDKDVNAHTPTPWFVDSGTIYAECQLDETRHTSEMPLLEFAGGREENYTGNLEIVAKAVNLHDELVEALKTASMWTTSLITREALDQIKSAQEKAK